MCGIVGVWDTAQKTTAEQVEAMTTCLAHRGPDDQGLYEDSAAGVFLVQQRLALIDLSATGHQPMTIGSHTITYNGEVYNYQEVREELAGLGVTFGGDSDTEVVLRAWQQWGSEALHKFRGMFAFAIWDEIQQTLTLCRDRAGVKPLYVYQKDGLLIFASELKAILEHPQVERALDHEALQLYLQLGYVPAPYSIFQDIRKVLPAHLVTVDANFNATEQNYWQPVATESKEHDEATVLAELDDVVRRSCELRMIADVPVGVFLSGGIDSSLVTAVLKQQGYNNLSTFTIGFQEATHNEADAAKAVANHLGTNHHELTCTTEEAQAIIPKLPHMFDEPFADASAIPTFLLSQFAKQHVTAALSADGGDELFGGYTRYQSSVNLRRKFQALPPYLGGVIWFAAQATKVLAQLRLVHPNKVHKFKKAYWYYKHRHSVAENYAVQQSYFTDAEMKKLMKRPEKTFIKDVFGSISIKGIRHHMRKLQRIDFGSYLPDDILVKVDRASMAVSLEGREPLLDHHLIEFAAGVSDELMHKEPGNKYLLRQLLYQYLPRELVDRSKQGFGVPLNDWLKGDVKHLLDVYLDETFIKEQGIFDAAMVAKEKKDFLSGAQPYNRIWNIIVFQMWYENLTKNSLIKTS